MWKSPFPRGAAGARKSLGGGIGRARRLPNNALIKGFSTSGERAFPQAARRLLVIPEWPLVENSKNLNCKYCIGGSQWAGVGTPPLRRTRTFLLSPGLDAPVGQNPYPTDPTPGTMGGYESTGDSSGLASPSHKPHNTSGTKQLLHDRC